MIAWVLAKLGLGKIQAAVGLGLIVAAAILFGLWQSERADSAAYRAQRDEAKRIAIENAQAVVEKDRQHALDLSHIKARAEREAVLRAKTDKTKEEIRHAIDAGDPVPDAFLPLLAD